jgi:hypothetical protein
MTTETTDRAFNATIPSQRASHGFQRGYEDARDGRTREYAAGSFAAYDYEDGRKAAWAAHRANSRMMAR